MHPRAYTMDGVMAVNGSSAEGGCPTACVGMNVGIVACNCDAYAGLPYNATTGAIIDNVVPTLDIMDANWAAPLFTMRGSTDTITLSAKFVDRLLVLSEVELYLFYCPSWGITVEEIIVHSSATFPNFFEIWASLGSMTLTAELENCESLTRVSIPLTNVIATNIYAIEFTNPSGTQVEWLHLAEVRYSDQPIPTPIPTTTMSGMSCE